MNRILMCPPKHYGINYSINPWMDVEDGVDSVWPQIHWTSLRTELSLNREIMPLIYEIDPVEGLPDMVFTANAGLPIGEDKFILSNFRHAERKGEEHYFRDFFEEKGFKVIYPKNYFEGAGDALFLMDKLVGGYGFRTERVVYDEDVEVDVMVKLVNPYFYHLDTCFCPLNNGDYLIYPDAFEDITPIVELGGRKIEVTERDAKRFGCNAVVLGNDIYLPDDCWDTKEALEKIGYTVHGQLMSTFIKAGGACKCLTLKF